MILLSLLFNVCCLAWPVSWFFVRRVAVITDGHCVIIVGSLPENPVMQAVAVDSSMSRGVGDVDDEGERARAALARFRIELYWCFAKYGDALFELCDAVLCGRERVQMLAGLSLGGTAIFIMSFMPYHPVIVAPFVLLILVLFINSQFYVFLRGRKNFFFALTAIPFHLLYFFYNGIAFCAGTILYWSRRKPACIPKSAGGPVDPVK